MLICEVLYYFFSSLCILCSFFVVFSKNPAYSVFFLVLSFLNVSSLLFLIRLEFLPIIFILVYVGATSVLFLFVIFMLNIKVARLKVDNANYAFLGFIFVIIAVLEFLFVLRFETVPLVISNKQHLPILSDLGSITYLPDFFVWDQVEHNGRFLGRVLFTKYFIPFIVCGFILLLAMISAIVLTLNKKFAAKTQNIYAQVLRNYRLSISSKQ